MRTPVVISRVVIAAIMGIGVLTSSGCSSFKSSRRLNLAPDIELFWKQQAELEELVAAFNAALRQARVAVIAWSRAHQRLASGITDPAEIDIFGIAKKAAGNYVPIP